LDIASAALHRAGHNDSIGVNGRNCLHDAPLVSNHGKELAVLDEGSRALGPGERDTYDLVRGAGLPFNLADNVADVIRPAQHDP
jgi:hypothetical protein